MTTTQEELKQTDWKRWLAENLLLGNDPDLLRDFMVRQGLKAQTVQHEINAIVSHPAFRAAGPYVHAVRRFGSLEDRLRALEAYGTPKSIDRRSGLSRQDFYRDYFATNTPVILEGAIAQWPALQWTTAGLRERVGEVRVQIMSGRDSDPNYQPNQDNHMVEVTMGRFIDMVEQGGKSNDYYMVSRNRTFENEGMQPLLADLKPLPAYVAPETTPRDTVLWFGPAGTRTPLHHDPINNLYCQVMGRKRFWLVQPNEMALLLTEEGYYSPIDASNPNLEHFPQFSGTRVHTFELNAGECLFIPIGWWHQVEALDVSMSVSFDSFSKPDAV